MRIHSLFKPKKPDVKKMEAEKEVKGLIKALRHEDREVRREAIRALGNIKDLRTINPLSDLIKDDIYVPGLQNYLWYSSISSEALFALTKIVDVIPESVISVLIDKLKHSDPKVRNEAYQDLGGIYEKAPESHKSKIIIEFTKALKGEEENEDVRCGAMVGLEDALSKVDQETKRNIIPLLTDMLRNKNEFVCLHAAAKLVYTLGTEAVPLLLEVSMDDDEEVAYNAALGFQYYMQKLREDDENVHKALIPAIRYFTEIIEKAAEKGLDTFILTPRRVNSAITALERIGDLSAIPALEKLSARLREEKGWRKDSVFSVEQAISMIKEREQKKEEPKGKSFLEK